jgi:hypothetical protein
MMGGLIQIIYAGDTTIALKTKGTIKGQGQPRIKKPIVPSKQGFPLSQAILGFIGLLAVFLGSSILVPIDAPPGIPKFIKFMFLFAVLILVVYVIYVFIMSFRIPPFGFN